MTYEEAAAFVEQLAAQRSADRGEALWWADGKLHYPFTDRVIGGDEIGALADLTAAQSPTLTWEMLGWTWRGEVIVVEWLCTNTYGDRVVRFAGVDKLTLREGKIAEEIVYADTGPLRAMRAGAPLEPLMVLPKRVAA